MFTHSLTRRLISAGLIGLVLLDSDDGSASGGASAGQQGGDQTADTQGADGSTDGDDDSTPSFTPEQQAAINAEVARQLSSAIKPKLEAAKSQWAKELEAMAEAENQTAEQRAAAEAQRARQEAEEAIRKANDTLVKARASVAAVEAGAKAERVEALLRLADLSAVDVLDGEPDETAVKAAVTDALRRYPEFKAQPASAGGASGGDLNAGDPGTPKPKSLAEAVSAHYATA